MSSKHSHAPFPATRIALLASLSLLLLLAAVSFLLFALFYNPLTDNVVKVQAADLEIAATYVKIEGTRVDTDEASPTYGRFLAFSEEKNMDLADEEDRIFHLECAAPTMTQKATFTASNEGNLAFHCEIRLCDLLVGDENAAASEALTKQILVRIACGTDFVEFRLCDYAAAGSALQLRELAPGATKEFTVTATFMDDETVLADGDHTNDFSNSDAIGGALAFDITLIATQTYDIANAE